MDFREADITNLDDLRKHVEGCDVVLHQAAIPSVSRSVEDPSRSHINNATGSLNVLEASRRSTGVRRVVLACSSSTYGAADGSALEETVPPKPMSPYAVSKYAAEQYARVYAQLYKLETVCLRYFNVYGPFQRTGGIHSPLVPTIIEHLLSGRPIPVHGNGRQSRDFTYIDNVVDANIRAAQTSGISGEVFNVGCGRSVSVLDVIGILAGLNGTREVSLQHMPSRPADMDRTLADITKARTILGYEPRIGLEVGMSRTLDWYRVNRDQ
jgi:nucleoside-diphosphate-sugar epimerase